MLQRLIRILYVRPSCRRRWRALAHLGSDAILFKRGSRALSPATWIALLALFMLMDQEAAPALLIVSGVGLFIGLCVISLFDIRYLIIPDGPLIFLCVIAPLSWNNLDLEEATFRLAAAAIGYSTLRLIDYAFKAARGQAGVGSGDARLYAVAGLWLGFSGLPGCLVYATLSALVWSVIALRVGEHSDLRQPMPFGPHLALGLWLSYVLGPLQFG